MNHNFLHKHGFFPASFLPPFLLFTLAMFPYTALESSLALSDPSVQFSCSIIYDSLRPHGLQHSGVPCPSPTPRACSNSCPLNRWCHPTITSSAVPFSSHLQSFPASGSFPMSQFFPSGGQRIGASASASVLPVNIQDWFPLGLTGWLSMQSKGLSRVFNTTVQKHQFFGTQPYDPTQLSIHDYWKNHSFDYTDLWQSDVSAFWYPSYIWGPISETMIVKDFKTNQ